MTPAEKRVVRAAVRWEVEYSVWLARNRIDSEAYGAARAALARAVQTVKRRAREAARGKR